MAAPAAGKPLAATVLTPNTKSNYSNYMRAKVIRVGNSRGVRIPKALFDLYGINEGDSLELEERREGILLRRAPGDEKPIGYGDAYREMAAEAAEQAEWADWDDTTGDGLGD